MKTILFILLLNASAIIAQNQDDRFKNNGLLHCTVTDMKGKPKAGETLIFDGIKTKTSLFIVTDKKGKAEMLLPKGNTYKIKVLAVGEEKDYSTVEIPKEEGHFEATLSVKFELPLSATLDNVLFETGSARLLSLSFKSLDQICLLMQRKETMTVRITGHTDNTGDAEKNILLSIERANSVKSYMVKRGISGNRIKTDGKGAEMPVADNETIEGKKLNRRTELAILSE